MKAKYLLSAMLGGAMLTACSVEDDFNTALVGQEAESTAPVFTVHFDNEDDPVSRSVWKDKGQYKVNFIGGDQMSLFHGVTSAEDGTLTDFQNAVYVAAKGENDGEGLKFTTAAMVTKGDAIMIWPADTVFENRSTGKIQIRISDKQNADTKKNTPYMSEILEIEEYADYDGYQDEDKKIPNSKVTEGYGRNYDISLKRVASQLGLALKYENTSKINDAKVDGNPVDPTSTSKMEINSGDENNKVFTTTIDVVKSADAPVNPKNKLAWSRQSELDLSSANGVQAIVTEDKEPKEIWESTQQIGDETEAEVMTFTLLPTKTGAEIADKQGVITVYTTYGKVVLNDDAKVWKNHKYVKNGTKEEEKDEFLNVTTGLNTVLSNLWTKTTTAGDFCVKNGNTVTAAENQGGYFPRAVKVDMSKLDMDNLHIKNKKVLRDAIAVYKSIKPAGTVRFILDGNNGEAANTFVMDKATWEDVVNIIDNPLSNNQKLEFALCEETTAEGCTNVRLDATSEEEVPELRFAGDKKAVLQLKGTWKYEKGTYTKGNATVNKKLEGVETLEVLSGSTLTLKNTITNTEGEEFEIVNRGTVNVSGIVTLKEDMTNYNTVKIPAKSGDVENRLGVYDVTLTNMEAQNPAADKKGWDEGALIENGGTLAIVDNTTGKIYNYGKIEVKNSTARTLISENAEGEIAKNFATGSNRIGTILLNEKTGSNNNTKVNGTNKGFIKLIVTDTEVNSDNVGTVANYIIVNGGTKIAATSGKSLPTSVNYIEIQSGDEVVFGSQLNKSPITSNTELSAIMVPKGKSINIPENVTVKTNVLLAQGTVVRSGSFEYKTLVGYYGGATTDTDNIFTFTSKQEEE